MKERELRTKLVMQAGFSLSDIPLIMRFINGDDEALTELEEFRKWKEERKEREERRAFCVFDNVEIMPL